VTTLSGETHRVTQTIRIVLAEDQGLLRDALATLLSLEGDFDVVAQAADGPAALEAVRRLRPDILLTDVEMPGMNGIDVAGTLRQGGSATRTLILTTFGRAGYLKRALDAGVRGYLLKDTPMETLAAAIRTVAAGGRAIAPDLAEVIWDAPADPLTERERRALALAEEGHPNQAIAERLGLSVGTVRNYLSEAAQKLGAGNRTEAARIARANGWL